MARTKVTTLVRVRQGKNHIEFDYDKESNKLSIELRTGKEGEPVLIVPLKGEAVNALRDLLEVQYSPKLATKLPPGTYRKGEEPPKDDTLSEEELARGAEEPIAGMA